MMAIQVILCMETNKRAATDYIYINETISRFYSLDNKIKISPIYMNNKMRYNSKDVVRKVHGLIKDYGGGTRVIYCIDTDSFEVNQDHARELKEINEYCKKNNYDMIWFCHDVEEVYQGKRIPDKQKVKEAGVFRTKKSIYNISEELLRSDKMRIHNSNILTILDKYLPRKNNT